MLAGLAGGNPSTGNARRFGQHLRSYLVTSDRGPQVLRYASRAHV